MCCRAARGWFPYAGDSHSAHRSLTQRLSARLAVKLPKRLDASGPFLRGVEQRRETDSRTTDRQTAEQQTDRPEQTWKRMCQCLLHLALQVLGKPMLT